MNDVLSRLVDRVEGRYYGKYRGTVSDNDDPSRLGRLRAKVPRILGTEQTGWALPAFIYGGASEQGLFAVPDVGAGVWIEFEEGDLSYPIWSGTWYASDQIPESAGVAQKVLKTKSGHKIVLDDDAGSIAITDSNGNSVTMESGKIEISAGSAQQIVIDAPVIQLVANSTHPLVFGDNLLTYLAQLVQSFNLHMHPGETTPTGGPVTPMVPTPPMTPPDPSLVSTAVTTG